MEQKNEEVIEIITNLRRIIKSISSASKKLRKNFGITIPQLVCLNAVANSTDELVSLKHISQVIQLSAPTVSGIVDRLEKSGLLRRERKKDDRRKLLIQLTDKGREVLANTPESIQIKLSKKINALSQTKRTQIKNALRTLTEVLEAEDLDASPILTAEEELKS